MTQSQFLVCPERLADEPAVPAAPATAGGGAPSGGGGSMRLRLGVKGMLVCTTSSCCPCISCVAEHGQYLTTAHPDYAAAEPAGLAAPATAGSAAGGGGGGTRVRLGGRALR